MKGFSARFIVFLSVITSASTETRTGSFSKYPLHTLNVSPFLQTSVFSSMDCAILCTRTENCLSINVANSDAGLQECQLLNVDKETSPQMFANSARFHHYARVWGPCEKPRCLNGAQCIVNSLGTGYKCQCQPGFMGMHCETVKWIKFNNKEVTFGAKDNKFGSFNITEPGEVFTVKLVWKSGYVTIDKNYPETRSHWWSNTRTTGVPSTRLGVIITDATSARKRIIPLNKDVILYTNEFYLSGYNSMSPYIIYKNFTTPYRVSAGQQLRVWFSQDRDDAFEESNDGTCNIDIYGLYV